MNSDPKKRGATEPSLTPQKRHGQWLSVRELCVFSMLGALMFCSKLLMEWAPNIHFLDMFIITFTVVYRKKALVPIYIFVLLTLLFNGFSPWLLPYLYVWLLPWALTMLVPRRLPRWATAVCYLVIGGLHGILFGILYAPAQALLFGLDVKGMITWIAAGSLFDITHAVGNIAACTLVTPLAALMQRLERRAAR